MQNKFPWMRKGTKFCSLGEMELDKQDITVCISFSGKFLVNHLPFSVLRNIDLRNDGWANIYLFMFRGTRRYSRLTISVGGWEGLGAMPPK